MATRRMSNIPSAEFGNFIAETFAFGSLKGFRNFSCHLRGREELILRVNRMEPIRKLVTMETKSFTPASPSERELEHDSQEFTVFLIGAYVKYNRPLVWMRTNQDDFLESPEKDVPVMLETCAEGNATVHVHQIVQEILEIGGEKNAFEVDFNIFEKYSVEDCLVYGTALMNFLIGAVKHCQNKLGMQRDFDRLAHMVAQKTKQL